MAGWFKKSQQISPNGDFDIIMLKIEQLQNEIRDLGDGYFAGWNNAQRSLRHAEVTLEQVRVELDNAKRAGQRPQ